MPIQDHEKKHLVERLIARFERNLSLVEGSNVMLAKVRQNSSYGQELKQYEVAEDIISALPDVRLSYSNYNRMEKDSGVSATSMRNVIALFSFAQVVYKDNLTMDEFMCFSQGSVSGSEKSKDSKIEKGYVRHILSKLESEIIRIKSELD